MNTMTPTTHKRRMRQWHNDMCALLVRVKHCRVLRAGGILDREDAEGTLDALYWEHKSAMRELRMLKSVTVVKNSHISDNARARHERRYGKEV